MAVLTTTTQKRNAWILWLDHCRDGVFVNQFFFGKTIGGVPEPWAEAVQALEMALRATGYTPKSAWAYNFRGISGALCTCSSYGSCSLHGNGIAIDIDPVVNPYKSTSVFRWSDTAFTPEQIDAVETIKNTKGEQEWFWGGRWNSIKDYMHFEANVDPGSAQVDWSTVKGYGGTHEEDDMLKMGDRGADVTVLQNLLKSWLGNPPGVISDSLRNALEQIGTSDGVFGQKTHDAVWQLQAHYGLTATGIANSIMLSILAAHALEVRQASGTHDPEARKQAAEAKALAEGAHGRLNKLHDV